MTDNALVIRLEDLPPEVLGKLDEFQALMKAVDKDRPSPRDVSELRKWFDDIPGLWAVFGDMTSIVQGKIIDRLVGSSGNSLGIATEKGIDTQRQALGYQHAPPLERLLIDHALICWLRWQDAEWQYTLKINESMTLGLASYWEKRLSAAQRRYLRACETLARVRKVTRQTPALQVNIAAEGGQQVNILGNVQSARPD